MHFRVKLLALAGMLIMAAACTPQPTAMVVAPTRTPNLGTTATPIPTITPVIRATLPPTWTSTPRATLTPDYIELTTRTPVPAACSELGEDPERASPGIRANRPTTIYWLPIAEAARYRLRISDSALNVIVDTNTRITSYTVAAALLSPDQVYGWEVTPIDVGGRQICPPRGSALFSAID